jgi:hypothetical protein
MAAGTITFAEEYLKRHKLDVKLVKPVDHAVVFLRHNGEEASDFQVLQIDYKHNEHHPGNYTVKSMRPMANGGKSRQMFEQIDGGPIEWDQYEDWVHQFMTAERSMRAVYDRTEVILVAWEMFCHCQDQAVSKYANHPSFFRSLDSSVPMIERFKSYQEIIYLIQKNDQQLFVFWRDDMMNNYIKRYCHWLAELLA